MLWFLASVPIDSATEHNPAGIAGSVLLFLVSLIMWNGMFVVQPNQAEVVMLFGHYLGSVKRDGWYYTNPLVTKRKISLRVHNFNSPQLKVK